MKEQNITPDFTEQDQLLFAELGNNSAITPVSILAHTTDLLKIGAPLKHGEVLAELLEKVQKVDFQLLAFPDIEGKRNKLEELEKQLIGPNGQFKDDAALRTQIKDIQTQLDKHKLKQPHYLIITIEEILRLAIENRWGICRNHNFIYLYNGAYWCLLDVEELKTFLGMASEKMGLDKYKSQYYLFKDYLHKQFLAAANLPTPHRPTDIVLVNLQNGTFEITPKGTKLRGFSREDFITYQLPFEYNSNARAPMFEAYLNKVLPDKERQYILAEYLGYVFIPPGTLKLEKTLLLYGSGANGKSVFFEVVNALLGPENVSSYSLQSLTNENGYYRAKLANMLVNYASEINGSLETAIFKQLVSGEPVEARLPYGDPFTLTHYAKLIFNCNELPRDVEHTNAYFRRFMIVPFDIIIPEQEQDKELSKKIIATELSGVFNWILEGLHRLIKQKKFSDCEAARLQVEQYKKQSDSVQMFLTDENYQPSTCETRSLKDLFSEYRIYCMDSGYRACSLKTFSDRLRNQNFVLERKNYGMALFIEKIKDVL
ncbi:DNA primase family protein [Chitinophaga defluvii]|uniref:Phage/plasmid primase, P4 family n=1 Tax=Chitinophaga defluvii TaxID=3163343 RepID=A0ABV2T6Q4_9BACT